MPSLSKVSCTLDVYPPPAATIAGNCRPQGLRTRQRLAGLEEGNGREITRPRRIHPDTQEALVPGAWTRGSLGWTYEREDRPHATICYEANLTDAENGWLRLHYRRN